MLREERRETGDKETVIFPRFENSQNVKTETTRIWRRYPDRQEQSRVSWLSGLFCSHQAQIGGGADLSRPDETKFLERGQMFFDGHEMSCPIMGRQT